VLAHVRFAGRVRAELGGRGLALFLGVLAAQLFWALFKAPLDVDGLVYHLPIVLEALDRGQWSGWTLPDWHVRNTPKLGEIPNLCLIALGGFRLAQLGHFVTGVLGAFAALELGRRLGFRRPAAYALAFWLAPIAQKQMGSQYVDLASWSFFLAAAAAALRPPGARSAAMLAAAVFLHAGTKLSGPWTALALAPLAIARVPRPALAGAALALAAGAATWMVPNQRAHGSPVFPLRLEALREGRPAELVPTEIGVGSDFHFGAWVPGLPRWLAAPLQLVVPEPVAVYDQGGGAFGFAVPLVLLLGVWAGRGAGPRGEADRARLALVAALALHFALMPGREVPRHGFLGVFALVTAAWPGCERVLAQSRAARRAFALALALQALYVLPDRTVLRGARGAPIAAVPRIAVENLRDIVRAGEPQAPGRWMHAPEVPGLRRAEPREARIAEPASFPALYWGRRFSNTVVVDPGYCRWPYCPGQPGAAAR
jgi:hypothetical protein